MTLAIFVVILLIAFFAAISGRSISFSDSGIFSGTKSITVTIGGDIMLDRNIRKLGRQNGYATLMAPLAPIFEKADIAVANLEGPVTTKPSKTLLSDGSYGTELHFTFAPDSLEALYTAGIDLVSLANNHTDNFYASGLAETKVWLDKYDIGWFGDPWNRVTASTTKIIDKKGISIAFVGYHAFLPGFQDILREVRTLSAAGHFVIVMPHWGEEYVAKPSLNLRKQAQELISAGAGAIIGAHPHVMMEYEWIGEVPVYYSLGNLLFDQYFSEETKKGLIVDLHIVNKDKQTRVESVTPHEIRNSSQNGASLL